MLGFTFSNFPFSNFRSSNFPFWNFPIWNFPFIKFFTLEVFHFCFETVGSEFYAHKEKYISSYLFAEVTVAGVLRQGILCMDIHIIAHKMDDLLKH